jgi:hypothetical protein
LYRLAASDTNTRARSIAIAAIRQSASGAVATVQRVSEQMRSETIAIHSGYDVEPTTKTAAVPIYQTVDMITDLDQALAAITPDRQSAIAAE